MPFKCYRQKAGQITFDMIPPKGYDEGCLIVKRAPVKEEDPAHNDYTRELAFAMSAVEMAATIRVLRGTNKEGQVKFIHKHPAREGITTTLQFEKVDTGLKVFISGTPKEKETKENFAFTLNQDETETLHAIMWHAIPQVLGIYPRTEKKNEQ